MSRISIILSLALGIGASCMAQDRLVIRGVTNQGWRKISPHISVERWEGVYGALYAVLRSDEIKVFELIVSRAA